MSDALRESLSLLRARHTPVPTGHAYLEPLVFGAYFDLLSAADDRAPDAPGSAGCPSEASQWLDRRFSALSVSAGTQQVLEEAGPPRISTLGTDFYSPTEISRWNRWLDMEPGNGMALAALEASALQAETAKIQRALQALSVSAPELHEELLVLTREILVLRPDGTQRLSFRGASSFALWGASAFNQRVHDHWTDYLKTLVHESAHTLLFALAREEPLVLNAPEERYGSPLRDDHRPMDGIFHAAFVSAREAYALDKCLDTVDAENDATSQALAERLASELSASVCAFWDCCAEMAKNGQLSPLGISILQDTTDWMTSQFSVLEEHPV